MTALARIRTRPGRLPVVIGLVLGTIVVIYPLLWMVSYSLRPLADLATSTGIIPERITFENYETVFNDARFPVFIRNSLLLASVGSLITLIISAPAAYAINRIRFRGRGLIATAFLFTQIVPAITLVVPLFLLARQMGVYDSLAGLAIVYAALNVPFITLLLHSFFAQIPQDMEEAALVDGADSWKAFLHVALPLTRPGLITAILIAFLAVWEEYLLVLTLAPSPANHTIPVGLTYFTREHGTDYTGLMAASVVSCIPAMLLFFGLSRFIIRGITTGGVKG